MISIQRQIFEAAEKNVEELRNIMDRENIPLTLMNAAGQTLAHIAAKAGNVETLRFILEKEPNLLHKKDGYNCSILHLATVSGALDAVRYLVEDMKADISHLSGRYRDRTAVHAATEFNHLHILKYFVEERNVDVDMPHPKQRAPPLFLAVKNRHWNIIEYLVERPVNLQALNANQETVLFVVVRENYMTLMEYLLDQKKINYDIDWGNYYGETLVHVAVSLGRMEMLEYLVEKKNANVNLPKRTDKRTPLHYAASRDSYQMCKYLLDHGADARKPDLYGSLPADHARDPRLVEYLDYAAKPRNPRSVVSAYSSLEAIPSPLPFESTQESSIGDFAHAVSYPDGDMSFRRATETVSHFNGFLVLARWLLKSVKSEHGSPNSIFLASPSSSVQSRISPVALEVIDAKPNFIKL